MSQPCVGIVLCMNVSADIFGMSNSVSWCVWMRTDALSNRSSNCHTSREGRALVAMRSEGTDARLKRVSNAAHIPRGPV